MRTTTPGRKAPGPRISSATASRAALLSAALLTAGCGGGSPTSPDPTPNVAGRWSTSIVAAPPGADWSSVDLVIEQTGTAVSGTATGADATVWDLSGEVYRPEGLEDWWLRLSVLGLPGTSECGSYRLLGTDIEYHGAGYATSISGRIDGRCGGTLSAEFDLIRTGG